MTLPIETPRLDKLLTVKEAAERIGRTESQMRWLIHANKAPRSGIVGGRRMMRESDVQAYIDAAFTSEATA